MVARYAIAALLLFPAASIAEEPVCMSLEEATKVGQVLRMQAERIEQLGREVAKWRIKSGCA